MTHHRIALLMSALQMGGAQRVITQLARGFVERGLAVDMVMVSRRGPLLSDLPAGIRIVELGVAPRPRVWGQLWRLPPPTRRLLARVAIVGKLPKVVRSLPKVVAYLQREKPGALLTTLPDNNITALWAAWLAGEETRVVVREANMLSTEVRHADKAFERRLLRFARQWYPLASGVVSVSDGVALDLVRSVGLARERITTIHNPVDIERVRRLAGQPVEDPWLEPGAPPLLLAVGRLFPQKDYPTLLRALALVRERVPARLLILGEGSERPALQALAGELGLAEAVRMPGIHENPYAYMRRAALLVLSSTWEGFPNVLIEALACGCPVVSTDCPSGPSELLDGGAWGRLVPVGDPRALAQAILETLAEPPEGTRLLRRAQHFSPDRAVDRYLQVLLGNGAPALAAAS